MTGPDAEFAIASTQMLMLAARMAVATIAVTGAAALILALVLRWRACAAFIRFLERIL